jgi:hypothetical protein
LSPVIGKEMTIEEKGTEKKGFPPRCYRLEDRPWPASFLH